MADTARAGRLPERFPEKWEPIVQIVGTFGLAVFLVLYYVLVMQPRERARYEELRRSVDSAIQMVERGQTFLNREQAESVKALFVLATSPELARHVERILSVEETSQRPVPVSDAARLEAEIRRTLEDVLIARTRLLHGLVRKSGGELSTSYARRIRGSEVADRLAMRVVTEWPYRRRYELLRVCEDTMVGALRSLPEAN